MSNDAVGYVYQNIGYDLTPVKDGAGYTYQNIGWFGVKSFIGRVVGFAGNLLTSTGYTYANVLQQISGSTRTLEDGAVRRTESGSERTIE